MAFALVGAAGAVSLGTVNTAVTPAWGAGSSRTAGNLLLCFISGMGSTGAPSAITGWSIGPSLGAGTARSTILYRVATGSDAAPTIPAAASQIWAAHLEEWSGGATTSPLDQSGSNQGTTSPLTTTLAGADAASGELVAIVGTDIRSVARATNDTWTSNHGTPTLQGSNNGTSIVNHYSHATLVATSNSGADTAVMTASITTSVTVFLVVAASFKLAPPATQNISAVGAIASAAALGSGAKLSSGIKAVGAIASGENFGIGYRGTILATSGLRGYWRLGEPSGTTAVDETGVNNGSLIGTPTHVPGATGDGNTGLASVPSNCMVAIPDNNSLDLGNGPLTTEAWVNRNNAAPGGWGGIVSKSNGAYYMRLDQTTGQLAFVRSQQASIVVSTGTVPLTGWHHCVATKNGSTTKLYIDKVDVTGTVTDQTLTDDAQMLFIGSDNVADFGGTEAFIGSIDEVAVYARDLTPTEVAAHFDAAPKAGGPAVSRGINAVGAIATAEAFGVPVLSGTAVVVGAGAPYPYQGAGYYGG